VSAEQRAACADGFAQRMRSARPAGGLALAGQGRERARMPRVPHQPRARGSSAGAATADCGCRSLAA